MSLSTEIRAAIKASGLTHYRLWKLTGVDKTAIGRFMAGKSGLHTANLDAIAELLGLHVTIERRPKHKKEK